MTLLSRWQQRTNSNINTVESSKHSEANALRATSMEISKPIGTNRGKSMLKSRRLEPEPVVSKGACKLFSQDRLKRQSDCQNRLRRAGLRQCEAYPATCPNGGNRQLRPVRMIPRLHCRGRSGTVKLIPRSIKSKLF